MPRPPILPVIDWKSIFEKGKTWAEWLDAAESKDQTESMKKRYDSMSIPGECRSRLGGATRPVHVIAIAEDWCGDVVRHAPALACIENAFKNVQARFIAREDNPDLFARFLTNGGEAIPKFIFLNSDFVECGNWGPMQWDCRLLVARGKAVGDVAAGRKKVKEIYAADPGCQTVLKELCDLAELAGATTV